MKAVSRHETSTSLSNPWRIKSNMSIIYQTLIRARGIQSGDRGDGALRAWRCSCG